MPDVRDLGLCCPNLQDLHRFLLGQLPDEELEHVQQHLSQCRHCLGTIGSLQVEDTLVEAMRAPGPTREDPEVEAVDELMLKLSGLHLSPTGKARETADSNPRSAVENYDFLAPPQGHEELGRLGPYRVLKVLGAGGMGVVFEAEDPLLRRRVALKAMKPSLAANAVNRQRFLREAQATAAIDHDHIVTIHQVGEDRGVPFLAMQLLHGETLEERLRREGRLPLAEVLRIGREIAAGLAAAHARGLIHRDVKPANVWLEEQASGGRQPPEAALSQGADAADAPRSPGRVKLLDFGLARAADDDAHLSQYGMIIGTPQYMAPEQAEGHTVDHRGDLFSLGCLLYRLSSGRLPFQGSSSLAVLRALAAEQPEPLGQLNPEAPPALADLTMRLLNKDPKDRPATAEAVVRKIEAMESALADKESLKRPRRRWLPAAVAAALLIGALVYEVTILIRTPDGTLVVEVDDPQVQVTIQGDGGVVITGAGTQEVRLRPGSYRWQVTKDGKPIRTDIATITKGSKQVVKVTLEPPSTPEIISAFKFTPPPPGPLDKLDPAKIPAEERFAWQPKELVQVLGEHRGRHWGQAVSVAFSPDGKLITSGGSDGVIRFWDADTLRERAVLLGHSGSVSSVNFSPDGSRLLSGGHDRSLRLWDVATGKLLRRYEGHTGEVTTGVTFSADGRRGLSGGWEGDNSVRLWDLETGKELVRCTGHTGGVRGVALSADGRRALSGGNDRTVRLWDLETGKELRCFQGHTDRIACVALSPDGRLALSGGGTKDPTVRLWEVAAGRELRAFVGHTDIVMCVAFSRDGRRALSSGGGSDNTVRHWDVESGKELRRLQPAGGSSVAFSPDGLRALAACAGLLLWDLETGKELFGQRGHPAFVRSVAFSPDGRRILSGSESDKTVRLWDVDNGQELRRLEGHTAGVHSVALSPDGRQALSGGQDRTMRLWDVATGKELLRFRGHTANINSVAFAPDGRQALSGGDDGARLWDVASGRELRHFPDPDRQTWASAFSPDGRRVLSTRHLDTVVLWDVGTGQALRRYTSPGSSNTDVVFAPDGRSAFSGGSQGALRLWDLDAAEPRHRTFFKWHTHNVRGLAVAPDGKTLASSGDDGRVILWEAASGTKLREWQLPGQVWNVAFAADGRHLATANANGTVYVLRLAVP